MLGTNVGFVWPPHIQQCPTMPNNVGICWNKCWHRLARALLVLKMTSLLPCYRFCVHVAVAISGGMNVFERWWSIAVVYYRLRYVNAIL